MSDVNVTPRSKLIYILQLEHCICIIIIITIMSILTLRYMYILHVLHLLYEGSKPEQ